MNAESAVHNGKCECCTPSPVKIGNNFTGATMRLPFCATLLMVVGELDENVDPSSTLQVVNALIQAKKDFDLIVAPGLGHTALRSSGPIDYGLRRQYDFFLKHLAGVTTPDWNALIDAAPPEH